ncbi:Diacylglycerol kinase, partial [Cryomyces antarcticus]
SHTRSALTVAAVPPPDDGSAPATSSPTTTGPSTARTCLPAPATAPPVVLLDKADSDRDRDFLNLLLDFCSRARSSVSGLIRSPSFPAFATCWRQAMASSQQYQVPGTPRVISPSPTPSENSQRDGYFVHNTRAKARATTASTVPIHEGPEHDSSSSDPDMKRARARSRSPLLDGSSRRRRMSGLAAINPKAGMPSAAAPKPRRRKPEPVQSNGSGDGKVDGHLSPSSANRNYWRELSRSPSPLGLIPIHQEWRSF